MNFAYEKPKTADALAALLNDKGARAHLLAGGTDLLVQLRARLLSPELLIDVKGVEELQRFEHHPDGALTIGAAVVLNRLVDNARLRPVHEALCEGASQIATYALRNRATVVGNIANASPCADMVPGLCVLGASVELCSQEGRRTVLVSDFIRGVRATQRKPNEFISAVLVPPQSKTTRTFFIKRQRVRGHDLALVNAALLHDPERKLLRLAIGSCSPAPVVLELSDLLPSCDGEQAARRAMDAIRPISDVRASAEYRTDMTGVLVRRLFACLAS